MSLGKLDRSEQSPVTGGPRFFSLSGFEGPPLLPLCLQEETAEEPAWLWQTAAFCHYGWNSSLAIFFYAFEMQSLVPVLSDELDHLAEAYLKSPNHITHPVISHYLVI